MAAVAAVVAIAGSFRLLVDIKKGALGRGAPFFSSLPLAYGYTSIVHKPDAIRIRIAQRASIARFMENIALEELSLLDLRGRRVALRDYFANTCC